MSYFVQKATQNSFKLANTDTINNIIRIGTAPPRLSDGASVCARVACVRNCFAIGKP